VPPRKKKNWATHIGTGFFHASYRNRKRNSFVLIAMVEFPIAQKRRSFKNRIVAGLQSASARPARQSDLIKSMIFKE